MTLIPIVVYDCLQMNDVEGLYHFTSSVRSFKEV